MPEEVIKNTIETVLETLESNKPQKEKEAILKNLLGKRFIDSGFISGDIIPRMTFMRPDQRANARQFVNENGISDMWILYLVPFYSHYVQNIHSPYGLKKLDEAGIKYHLRRMVTATTIDEDELGVDISETLDFEVDDDETLDLFAEDDADEVEIYLVSPEFTIRCTHEYVTVMARRRMSKKEASRLEIVLDALYFKGISYKTNAELKAMEYPATKPQ